MCKGCGRTGSDILKNTALYLEEQDLQAGKGPANRTEGHVSNCQARVVMNQFDCDVMEQMELLDLETEVHVRYIDDIHIAMRSLELGTSAKDGKLIVDVQKTKDD